MQVRSDLWLDQMARTNSSTRLIVHTDGTIAGCTENDERDGCRGREQLHDGSPIRCYVWSRAGCDHCGVHLDT